MIRVTLSTPRNVRQAVWDILTADRHGFLKVADVAEKSGIAPDKVYKYMHRLFLGGFIQPANGSRFLRNIGYRVVKTAGKEAPCLNKDGSNGLGSKTEALWRCIKILKRFHINEIYHRTKKTHVVTARYVTDYIEALTAAGYLRKTVTGKQTEYLLIKNTGGEAPQLLAVTEIYDPNLNQITLREVPDYE